MLPVSLAKSAMPESTTVSLVRTLGSHPSDPGSSPGGGFIWMLSCTTLRGYDLAGQASGCVLSCTRPECQTGLVLGLSNQIPLYSSWFGYDPGSSPGGGFSRSASTAKFGNQVAASPQQAIGPMSSNYFNDPIHLARIELGTFSV